MNRTQTALLTAFCALGAVSCGGAISTETGGAALTDRAIDVDVVRDDGVLHLRAYASGRSDFAYQGSAGLWHEGAVELVDASGHALRLDDAEVVSAIGAQLQVALMKADAELLRATPLAVTLPGSSERAFLRATVTPLSAEPHKPAATTGAEPHKSAGTVGAEPHDEGDAEPHDEDDDEAEPHLSAEPHGPTMKLL